MSTLREDSKKEWKRIEDEDEEEEEEKEEEYED